MLINSLGIYSTSLWLLIPNLVLNYCKKFIKQPTVGSLHNFKSGCHKMTNTAVTEHYPRLGLFAALIYWAVSCEGGWGLRSNAKISQTWSDINLVTAWPRSSSLCALSLVMAALFTARLQISGSLSHLCSQSPRHSRIGGEYSGNQWVVGISQNSWCDSWEAALVSSFWVEFVFLWCIFTNFVFGMKNVFQESIILI